MSKGMSKERILAKTTELTLPLVDSLGLTLWGIELVGAGKPLLRIYVESAEQARAKSAKPVALDYEPDYPQNEDQWQDAGTGVSVDQCSRLSRLLGLALEVEDMFMDAWDLEVSSPGLERVFFNADQLHPYIGHQLDLTLWEPLPDYPGRRKFRGSLGAVQSEAFTLTTPDPAGSGAEVEINFAWPQVRRLKLIHIFPDTSKPGAGDKASRRQGGGK